MVWVDDAHGAGVLGDRLRGTVEHVAPSGFKGRELIQSTTLSKAFGSYGGAILGPTWLRKSLLDSNRVVTGSSSLPAAGGQDCAWATRTRPGLAKRLQRNTVFVKDTLRERGWRSTPRCSPWSASIVLLPRRPQCFGAGSWPTALSVLHPLPIRQGRRVSGSPFPASTPARNWRIGRGTLPIKKPPMTGGFSSKKLRFVYRPFRRLSSSLLTLPSLFVSMKRM